MRRSTLTASALVLALGVLALADTLTPFGAGDVVTVATESGTVNGTLLDSPREGWIAVRPDGATDPVMIRTDAAQSVTRTGGSSPTATDTPRN